MPDISMCVNVVCSMRKHCFRYLAKPSQWQSFTCFTPVTKVTVDGSLGIDCQYFIPIMNIPCSKLRSLKEVDKEIKFTESKP